MAASNLEKLIRITLASISIIYVFGLIVTTLYYSNYTTSSLSLLRAQYIFAGLWLLLPLLFTYVFAGWAVASFEEEYRQVERWPNARIRRTLLHVVIIFIGMSGLAGFAMISGMILNYALGFIMNDKPLSVGFITSHINDILIVLAFSTLMAILALKSISLVKEISSLKKSISLVLPKLAWLVTFGSILLFLFIAYSGYFVKNIYPHIPLAFGGGRPIMVQFLLKASVQNGIAKNDILKTESSGLRSVPYKLILVTDKTYVIMVDDSLKKSVEFNKDITDGLIMLK